MKMIQPATDEMKLQIAHWLQGRVATLVCWGDSPAARACDGLGAGRFFCEFWLSYLILRTIRAMMPTGGIRMPTQINNAIKNTFKHP